MGPRPVSLSTENLEVIRNVKKEQFQWSGRNGRHGEVSPQEVKKEGEGMQTILMQRS